MVFLPNKNTCHPTPGLKDLTTDTCVVDELRDSHVDVELCDAYFLHVSLPASTLFSVTVACGGLSRMALYTSSQGSSASAAPAYGMVCSHSSMMVSGQGPAMHAENLYGQWVCTHCPNGATVQKRAARGTSTLLARGTGCGRPLGELAFGTYFPAG